eukprot:scaffold289510_cov30-Tisochrysis_lutea.AAC.1
MRASSASTYDRRSVERCVAIGRQEETSVSDADRREGEESTICVLGVGIGRGGAGAAGVRSETGRPSRCCSQRTAQRPPPSPVDLLV